jgi:hypothetical protein
MNIQSHSHVFDVIEPIKPLVLLYSNDLAFRFNATLFSIQNGKDEFLVVFAADSATERTGLNRFPDTP